jgi:hypothetical protein
MLESSFGLTGRVCELDGRCTREVPHVAEYSLKSASCQPVAQHFEIGFRL